MPHVFTVRGDCQFPFHPQREDLFHYRSHHLNHGDRGCQNQKWRHPSRIPARKQLIQKDPLKCRIDHADQRCDGGKRNSKRKGGAEPLHLPAHEPHDTLRTAFRHKVLPRGQLNDNPRKAGLELLFGHLNKASGRVIEHRSPLPEAIQYNEVIKIPEQDAGEDSLVLEVGSLYLVSVRIHSVIDRRPADVVRVGTVSGNAAVLAHLLQRNPLAIIGKNHIQAGSAALQRFQLHDYGNLRHLVSGHGFRLGFCFIPHSHLNQLPAIPSVTNEAGVTYSVVTCPF